MQVLVASSSKKVLESHFVQLVPLEHSKPLFFYNFDIY